MLIRKELLEEAIKNIKIEIDTDRNSIEYMIGEYVSMQYDKDYKAIRIEEPECSYYIYDYKDLKNLPVYLKENDFDIN